MSFDAAVLHLGRGALAGLGLFAFAAHAGLWASGSFDEAWLPIALMLGACASLALPARCDGARAVPPARPRWARLLLLGALAAVLPALVVGSAATPARHWDGVVAWEVKADFLTREPTIEQPYFAAPEVYGHSRDYPLLQPTCVAAVNRLLGDGAGRLLFPALFVVLLALVHAGVAARVRRGPLPELATIAVALTPAFVNSGSGSVDSGYAELFLATALAGVFAGVGRRDRLMLGAALACAVFVKPEGLVYGALVVAVLWSAADRDLLGAATLGWLAAAALWVPLQQRLAAEGSSPPSPWIAWSLAAVLALAIAASDAWLRRRRTSLRARMLLAALFAPAVAIALPAWMAAFGSRGGAMASYLDEPGRALDRLGRIPATLGGIVDHAVLRGIFGMTFVLLAVCAICYAWRRRPPAFGVASALVAVALVALAVPFLMSPQDDLAHVIRSSMTRRLLHWTPGVWIVVAVWLDDLGVTGATPRGGRGPDDAPAAQAPAKL